MENKKISVIVIIYKIEPYLRQCLESIIHQTYHNLEIILAVAKGTDQCEAICYEYAKKDGRFKVLSLEPKGAADARNHGLQTATGDYIGFVDGDDYIEEDMYETLVRNLEYYHCEIAVCGRFYEFVNKTLQDEKKEPIVMNSSEAFAMVLKGTGFFLHCWDKLFERRIFEGIMFPVDSYVEDRIVVNRLLDQANTIVYDSTPKYHFRERGDSLSKADKMSERNTIANEELERYVNKKHPELHDIMQSFMIYEHITCIQNLMMEQKNHTKELESHKKYLKENLKSAKKNEKISKKVYSKQLMAIYLPEILKWITKRRVKKQAKDLVRFQL
ncbi:MAG: glycosyltransferase family 2 protein [Lachnospiraceae bacterium]|nr:glycosyltransferase family 2 protein [Lachnospiraceae bacterium]